MSESNNYWERVNWNDEATLEQKVKALYNILNNLSKEMSIGKVPNNKRELQENINSTEARMKTPLSIAFVKMAEKGDIDEITASENANLFLEWRTGTSYKVNTLLQFNGLLYKVLQEHVSQADWTPDVTPSLYKVLGISENGIPYWSQPISQADSYMLNAETNHNNLIWVSDLDYNVWEPGVYGWHVKENIETPTSGDN